MNKLFFFASLFLLFIISCKTRNASKSGSQASDEHVYAFAQSKYPEISKAEFEEGKSILNNQCKSCHGIKHIQSKSEEEWAYILREMAPKAKITDAQKNNLTRYLFSYREALLMLQ